MTEKQRYYKTLEAIPEIKSGTGGATLHPRRRAKVAGMDRLVEHIDSVGYVSAPQMYRILRKALEEAAIG